MDEAGVFAGPAEAGGDCQRSLNDWARVDVGAGLEFAELVVKPGFESLEALEQNLVVVAGDALTR